MILSRGRISRRLTKECLNCSAVFRANKNQDFCSAPDCRKAAHLAANARFREANREKIRLADRRWYDANTEKALAKQRSRARGTWVVPDHKRKAHNAVRNALRRGKLTRQSCEVCGDDRRPHAHHDDYSRPLEVRWLCQKHHGALHKLPRDAGSGE